MPALIAHVILEMNTAHRVEILAITQACIMPHKVPQVIQVRGCLNSHLEPPTLTQMGLDDRDYTGL